MIRFAIVGTGWRSEFYARIAKALPGQFTVTAWLCRNSGKVAYLQEKYGFYATMDEDDVVRTQPDFLVCAVNKANVSEVTQYWAKKGIPVLSETPAALDIDTIRHMKDLAAGGYKIQVAEQYFLTPAISAMIAEVQAGTIGEPVSVTLSAMHDYHAASVIRRLLNTGLERVRITGKTFSFPVTNTRTRYETLTDGKVIDAAQKHLILEYESGKAAFYDFMSEQYRSPIRNTYINVRGTRGEICYNGHPYRDCGVMVQYDLIQERKRPNGHPYRDCGAIMVYYLDEHHLGAVKKLSAVNAFAEAGLNDDEAAVASLLIRMKAYVDTQTEAYPMQEALYDAYLSILMERAGKHAFQVVEGAFTDI